MTDYLPVYCPECARASLSVASASEAQVCAFCEGSARVVPGPIYRDGDWLAFAEIDNAVFEADIDGGEAATLGEELHQLLGQQVSLESVIDQMIARLPPLLKCRPALSNGPTRGLRMLQTLLLARGRDTRISLAEYRSVTEG